MTPLLTARPDSADLRDLPYHPSLAVPPATIGPDEHCSLGVPVLEQGDSPACTGFALATVAHTLLRRRVAGTRTELSPWMAYALARRYDDVGEDYPGSTLRGAMKGWHKHGVCALADWPRGQVEVADPDALPWQRALDHPLGAYYRVDVADLVALHAALAETGALLVSAQVHQGWLDTDGRIAARRGTLTLGGHAFTIVGYDREGFWMLNSWGAAWGQGGYAHLAYDDWLVHAQDAWVAQLAVPVRTAAGPAAPALPTRDRGVVAAPVVAPSLARHVISLRNDGRPNPHGEFATSDERIRQLARSLPDEAHVLVWAHGGMVGQEGAIADLATHHLVPALAAGAHPVLIAWNSDPVKVLSYILEEALAQRSPVGRSLWDWFEDRLDDMVGPLARRLGAKALWEEMKENAVRAAQQGGGLATFLEALPERAAIHLVGHSAGSVMLAPALARMAEQGRRVTTLTLWAPAATLERWNTAFAPHRELVDDLEISVLDDAHERADDVPGPYSKSILYLVSDALSDEQRVPGEREHGTPLLGMEWALREAFADGSVRALERDDVVLCPGEASQARTHTDFPREPRTLARLWARVRAATITPPP